jgi:maltodextrin utilization protein YvdJ
MTTPPSRWSERLFGLALSALAIAVMLNIAVRLIMAVLPVILVVAGVVLSVFVCWSFYRSRW